MVISLLYTGIREYVSSFDTRYNQVKISHYIDKACWGASFYIRARMSMNGMFVTSEIIQKANIY